MPALPSSLSSLVVLNLNPAIWETIAGTGWPHLRLWWGLESKRE
jgi:hypothetical protein